MPVALQIVSTALKAVWTERNTKLPGEITILNNEITQIKTAIDQFPKVDQTEAQKKMLADLNKKLADTENQLALLTLEQKVIGKDPIASKITELEGLYNVMLEYEEDVPKDHEDEVRQQDQ